MFPSIFSTTIWLNITTIFALLYAIYLCSLGNQKLLKGNSMYIVSISIIILTTIYIGTRPITCYADTWLYTLMFNLVQSGVWSELPKVATEPFWITIEYFCIETTDASNWLFVIACFYIICMSIAAYRWLPKHFLIAIIFLFTAFSFWSYATNTIRNGMATSIAMLGLSFFIRNKKEIFIGYALLIVATLTHKSCMLIIIATTLALFLRNTKINISFWLICIVLSLIFQEQIKIIFSNIIPDERMQSYVNTNVSLEKFSKVGVRWDFILYSAFPIFLGWVVISINKITNKTYLFILHTYIFANSFWVLINTIAYSDRFAYLSWFLYPILIVYPLCKFRIFKNQGIILGLLLIIFNIFTYLV